MYIASSRPAKVTETLLGGWEGRAEDGAKVKSTAAFAKNPGSISSTHTLAHICLTPVPGDAFLAVRAYRQTGKTPIYIK